MNVFHNISKMKTKTHFTSYSKMVLGLGTRKLAPAGHLAGGKYNALSADLCNANNMSGHYRMIASGLRVENRLGKSSQGK